MRTFAGYDDGCFNRTADVPDRQSELITSNGERARDLRAAFRAAGWRELVQPLAAAQPKLRDRGRSADISLLLIGRVRARGRWWYRQGGDRYWSLANSRREATATASLRTAPVMADRRSSTTRRRS